MRIKFGFRNKRKEERDSNSPTASVAKSGTTLKESNSNIHLSVTDCNANNKNSSASKRRSIWYPEFDNTKGLSVIRYMEQQEYEALKPIRILIDGQERKTYMYSNSTDLMDCRIGGGMVYPVIEVHLTGKRLMIITRDERSDYDMKHFIDMTDDEESSRFSLQENQCELADGFTILAKNPRALLRLEKAILLSQFEKFSLYKALTATLISSIGLNITDIHIVLRNAFPYEDWCYIFLNGEWVKVWAYIDSAQKNGLKSAPRSIKFFKDNKSMSKNNLICYIQQSSFTQEAFLCHDEKYNPNNADFEGSEAYNDRSPSPPCNYDQINDFLDRIKIIKYIGEVRRPIPKKADRSSRAPSFSQKNGASTTLSSLNPAPLRAHSRSLSAVSGISTMSGISDVNEPIASEPQASGLLIKPVPHSGVHHLETLIRFIIPFYDCLQLYGRPNTFNANFGDEESLLFGLPKLPVIDFVAPEEFEMLLDQPFDKKFAWDHIKHFLKMRLGDPNRRKLNFNTILSLNSPVNSDSSVTITTSAKAYNPSSIPDVSVMPPTATTITASAD